MVVVPRVSVECCWVGCGFLGYRLGLLELDFCLPDHPISSPVELNPSVKHLADGLTIAGEVARFTLFG